MSSNVVIILILFMPGFCYLLDKIASTSKIPLKSNFFMIKKEFLRAGPFFKNQVLYTVLIWYIPRSNWDRNLAPILINIKTKSS